MKYAKKIRVFILATAFVFGLMVVNSSAQVRGGVHFGGGIHRPVVGRGYYITRNPFGYSNYWGGYWGDPYWSNPYWQDPYLRDRQIRYSREKAVRDARNKIGKYKEEFSADGSITPEEQKKLDKASRKYDEAVEKLNKFKRETE